MILFINCSPKISKSNSQIFISDAISKINIDYYIKFLYKDSLKEIENSLKKCDKIIFVFPLYVDAPPSKLLEFFENIDKKLICDKIVYVVSQCGFLEALHNDIACEIVKEFCKEESAIYKGFFKIGAGEVLLKNEYRRSKIIMWDYKNKLQRFIKAVENNENIYLDTTIKFFLKFMFCKVANLGFKKRLDKI